MPGLLRGVARTAVVAGTWTAVSNAVSRRQTGRWAAQAAPSAQADQSLARADAQRAHAQWLAMPPPPGRYQRPMFQPAPPSTPPAPVDPPAPPPPEAGDRTDARLRQLRQLGALKTQGVLSDAEFEVQKRKILGG
jgi:hypothetical protein